MSKIIGVITENGVNILKKGAVAIVVIAGLAVAGKTIFAKGNDEDDYDEPTILNNDDDDSN